MTALVCFVGAAAMIATRLVLLAVLHATGARHPVRDAVSDYGVGPTRRTFEAMVLAAAAGWELLAVGTWAGYPAWGDRALATGTLALVGLTTALVGVVPTDLPGAPRTGRGVVHLALAVAQFALAYSLMGNVTRLLGDPLSAVLQDAALVGLVGLCVFLVPAVRRRVALFGLFERVFLVAVACFYLHYAVVSALSAR